MSRIRRISKAGKPEGDEEGVVLAITQLLRLNGARVHRVRERIPWGKTTSEAGIPDLFGWWPASNMGHPVHFFLEVKKPGGKENPAQFVWLSEASMDGVTAFWVDSVEMMVEKFRIRGIAIRGL